MFESCCGATEYLVSWYGCHAKVVYSSVHYGVVLVCSLFNTRKRPAKSKTVQHGCRIAAYLQVHTLFGFGLQSHQNRNSHCGDFMSRAWFIISVVFMRVHGHVGLAGNSTADIALLLPVSNLTVPHSYYTSVLRTQALKQ